MLDAHTWPDHLHAIDIMYADEYIENDRNKSFQKSSSLKEMYMDDWMDMLADKGHKQGVQVQWVFFLRL